MNKNVKLSLLLLVSMNVVAADAPKPEATGTTATTKPATPGFFKRSLDKATTKVSDSAAWVNNNAITPLVDFTKARFTSANYFKNATKTDTVTDAKTGVTTDTVENVQVLNYTEVAKTAATVAVVAAVSYGIYKLATKKAVDADEEEDFVEIEELN